MRRLATLLLLVPVLLLSALPAAPAAAGTGTVIFTIGSTTYIVNGQARTMDVAPFVDAPVGRTYVPARFLADALGVAPGDIAWDAATGTVTLGLEENGGWGRNIILGLVIGSKTMTVTNRPGDHGIQAQFISNQKVQMDAAPEIVDGRTMVPARWVAQAFGCTVGWDAAARTVTVQSESTGRP